MNIFKSKVNLTETEQQIILDSVNEVFDGEFTKIIKEDAENYYIYDSKTKSNARFSKSMFSVVNGGE